MEYKNIKNCRTTNIEKYIDCEVVFPDLSQEHFSFTAIPDDSTEHGRQIYQKARNGEFGEVIISKNENGYVWNVDHFVSSDVDVQQLQLKEIKNQLINEASQKISILNDAVEMNIATEKEKKNLTEWKKYRISVFRVDNGDWPEKPAS